ncbi:MAG: glycosyltransferase family 1 protein [Rhodocyclaceae bacterium]|jgi:glycosyltransferase involved in cell wall biosynthesis|nr:glycosyltransferase family 1 protein [Rhodocyclaceae bacterium]
MAPRRLDLALVTETFPPEVNGVAMTLGRLAQGMAERGHHVRLVRPRQPVEKRGLLANGDLLTAGLPIPRYPELRFGLPATGQLWKAWRERRPDIVHVATEGPLGYSALSAARRLGIATISSFHTNFHSYSRHYGLGWLRRGIVRYLRGFHNRTAATLAPTATLAEELAAQGFRNVRLLARGVDTALFNPARRSPALRLRWEARPKEPVCLVVSRLAPEKNLELAFEAFAAIRAEWPDARMVCVGDGPSAATLSRRHPEVLFCGMRTGEELAAHYASADLFLFPSLTETFGNVVAEALASGLPVVAFDLAAAGQLIVDGRNGWRVPPADERRFIELARLALRRVAEGRIERGECAASVRQLSWEQVLDRYENLLQQAVAEHDRTADAVLPAPTFGI